MRQWPTRKRVFYATLKQTYNAQQARAQQAIHGEGDVDMDSLLAQADTHAGMGDGTGMPGAGASGAPPGQLPDGLDPSTVATPDGVDNPYATGGHPGGGDPPAEVDGQRVTRRPDAETETDDGGNASYDLRDVHPAVRKHGSVVRVRGDDTADENADVPDE